MTRAKLVNQIKRIRLLALDVDGVLTDGRMIYGSDGMPVKAFDVRDGFGLVLAKQAGLKTAFITAEESRAVVLRAEQLKIDWVAQRARDKFKALQECLAHFRLKAESVCYVGDDLLDLPVLKRVGFSATVADGHPEIKRRVHYVIPLPGGRGAVRHLVEFILQAQGLWPEIVRRYVS